MRVTYVVLAAALLSSATACGSHNPAQQSRAAMAAEAACQSRFDHRFHVQPESRAISEGFVSDLGNGRLRVTGTVPSGAGEQQPGAYTCVVVPGPSGPRIARFDATRAP